jgi:hypothetical protein
LQERLPTPSASSSLYLSFCIKAPGAVSRIALFSPAFCFTIPPSHRYHIFWRLSYLPPPKNVPRTLKKIERIKQWHFFGMGSPIYHYVTVLSWVGIAQETAETSAPRYLC